MLWFLLFCATLCAQCGNSTTERTIKKMTQNSRTRYFAIYKLQNCRQINKNNFWIILSQANVRCHSEDTSHLICSFLFLSSNFSKIFLLLKGLPGPMGSIGYPGPRGVKVSIIFTARRPHMNFNDGFHANNDRFPPYQGAEGIRGLKGGKGEKVNTNHSVWLTGAIHLGTVGCNCASEWGSLKLWRTPSGKTSHMSGSTALQPLGCNGVWGGVVCCAYSTLFYFI